MGDMTDLSTAERGRLLADGNETAEPYPQACLHELITERAALCPERVAVACGGRQATFAELESRGNQVAHRLVELGVGPEVLVALSMERSVEMLVCLLGILKAGGAYVPIDPSFPPDRQEFMLEDAAAPVLITSGGVAPHLERAGVSIVDVERDWPAIAALPDRSPEVPSSPEQLAYVIYTSGSTGRPKGVEIPHRALVNFLWTMKETPGLTADDALVAVTTLSFDIAGLELYLPLVVGARVEIAPSAMVSDPRALSQLLADSRATVMQATPTTWRMLLDSGWRPPQGFRALCGGEPLPAALVDRLLAVDVELWNMYGPTETTIWSTCTRVRTGGASPSIGRPIANTSVYILDDHLQPVAPGEVGELWIGGHGLARGYRDRPELTAERFIAHPFGDRAGARIYRTGDVARFRHDGEIEFLGRVDHQVKVRGFRIELGEIETVLTRHPGVAEAVVVARGANADAELAAYIIAAGEPVSSPVLRDFAARSLPAYMVPSTVTTLDSFPLTPNGKINRKALPTPTRGRPSAADYVAPRTAVEQRLAEIWERELDLRPIGVTDDFFSLGVTSIVAAKLFVAIEQELGHRLALGAIFMSPTIEALAASLDSDDRSARWSSLIPIQPEGTQPPIFCVHGGAGTILHLAPLARRLGADQPFYGLQSRGLYGRHTPVKTVEEMATHYLAEMREVHPGGPWRLGGYCFGTLVAFEMAQRLIAEGEEVELLAMFNGPSPGWIKRWGWYGNQPGWRARHGMRPPPTPEQRVIARRRQRIERHVSRLRRVPGAIRHPQRAVHALKRFSRGPSARVRLALGLSLPEQLREMFFLELHQTAERAYEPTPYPNDILVFYGEGLYEEPSLGWEPLAQGGTITVPVPGEHTSNRQVMQEPNVELVAERLQQYLQSSA